MRLAMTHLTNRLVPYRSIVPVHTLRISFVLIEVRRVSERLSVEVGPAAVDTCPAAVQLGASDLPEVTCNFLRTEARTFVQHGAPPAQAAAWWRTWHGARVMQHFSMTCESSTQCDDHASSQQDITMKRQTKTAHLC